MSIVKQFFVFGIAVVAAGILSWQQNDTGNYTVDITTRHFPIISNHLKLGTHTNSSGETFDANSLYFIKNGQPWYPVMGEFHFSRFPQSQWESSILKMKAAGIDVIASYIFWIYHEEEEDEWNWSGNRDLRYFTMLCAKHQMKLFVRVGPWCHGEVRNGGFPDWLLQKSLKTRSNDSLYLAYTAKLFTQINGQLNGLYFKDNGPVIGAQIENEYRFNNPKGLTHIMTLKKMAVEAGIDVPYYTATAWPGSDIRQVDLIPVLGGYPEAPWDSRTTQLPLSQNYMFATLRNDPSIGNDLLGNVTDTTNYSGYRYPFATAEMGAGIQITYHRRPIIQSQDVTALAMAKIGSGANLIGYYMFHGGSNAIGKLTTLQESKATKYPNDYPIINYDFQSPIGEWGNLRPSYNAFKVLHYFLNDFGGMLARDEVFFPEKKASLPSDTNTLRWTVRANKNSGFVFINNFQRQLNLPDFNAVQFNIKTGEGELKIPMQPITIPANTQMILPFNMPMQNANLVYATAQPLCTLQYGIEQTFVFYAEPGIKAEYVFDEKNIEMIHVANAAVTSNGIHRVIKVNQPGKDCITHVTLNGSKKIAIITLTKEEALNTWKLYNKNQSYLCISNGEITMNKEGIQLQSTGKTSIDIAFYPVTAKPVTVSGSILKKTHDGIFSEYQLKFEEKNSKVKWASALIKTLSDHNIYNSLPLYKTRISQVPAAKFWDVQIPSYVMQGLSNAYLKIDYEGDTQAAYFDGKLIADDFYSGAPMMIGLNQFKGIAGKKIQLLITSLNDSSKIYFEKGIREPLVGRNAAEIKNISIVPQYAASIKLF